MTIIIKKAYTSHQKRMMKLKKKPVKSFFYIVKNKAGETIEGFDTKREALKYSAKRRGV
jgi:hypothetical protein